MSKHTNDRDTRDDGAKRQGRRPAPRRTDTRRAAILAAIQEG